MQARNFMFGRNNITFAPGQFTYESLFRFIQRNTKLAAAVDALDENRGQDVLRARALAAVQSADSSAAIFDHPACDLYLLSLFKHGEIAPAEFLTAYKYLMTLMEFTERQSLKVSDANLKSPGAESNAVKLVSMLAGDALSDTGKHYFSGVNESVELLCGYSLNEKDFIACLRDLSEFERCIIQINYESTRQGFNELAQFNPFFQLYHGNSRVEDLLLYSPLNRAVHPGGSTFYMPSHSLHRYLCQVLTPNSKPMELLPAFGRVSDETLHELHRQSWHIYPLYSHFVKSNMINAHGRDAGPASIAGHDEMHCVNASKFSFEERKIITHDLVTYFGKVIGAYVKSTPFSKQKNLTVQTLRNIAFDTLNDMFFVGKKTMQNPLQHFLDYMMTEGPLTGSEYITSIISYADLNSTYAAIYFVIACRAYDDSEAAEYWESVLSKINTKLNLGAEFHKLTTAKQLANIQLRKTSTPGSQAAYLECLTNVVLMLTMAKNVANGQANKFDAISAENVELDWELSLDFIQEIIKKPDSIKLQELMRNDDFADAMQQLILHCNLVVFDPIVPVTNTLLQDLKAFIEHNMGLPSQSLIGR